MSCDCGETEMRDVLLRIFLDKEIHLRLDLSDKFFDKFGKRNEAIGKQVELHKFENIEHGIICTICVNPKEYLYETNRKHKRVKKGTKGMYFDNYASHIRTLKDAEEGKTKFAKKQKQTRFQNNKGNMVMATAEKSELGQLNYKRYILPDGISSLPYGHKI